MFVYYVSVVEDLGSTAYGEKYNFHIAEVSIDNRLTTFEEVTQTIPIIREELLKINAAKFDREFEIVKLLQTYSKKEYQDRMFKNLTVLSFSLLREE